MTSWPYSRSCRTASIRSGKAGGFAGELLVSLRCNDGRCEHCTLKVQLLLACSPVGQIHTAPRQPAKAQWSFSPFRVRAIGRWSV
jgi:hypothetical protein